MHTLKRTTVSLVLALGFLLALALPATAAGSYSNYVDCTKNWWDSGKEVTAKTKGNGTVEAWTPNLTVTVFDFNEATARANDPSAQKGWAGGSTSGHFESGKTYCWW